MDGILVMSERDVLDIHNIMRGLAEKRPIFHSEADFQFALAWHIRKTDPECEIRLEWKPFPDKNMHVDMWLPTYATVIELKYPVTDLLNICHDGELFMPRKRRTNPARYGFVEDIRRLERMIDRHENVERGFAVLLTNHERFWKTPTSRWQYSDSAEFRIHHGRKLNGPRHWSPMCKSSTSKKPICLNETYEMRWRDYYQFNAEGRSRFRYLAVQVGD